MPTQSPRRTAHAMVAQFLRLHGYKDTLNQFREEASDGLEHIPVEGEYTPLEQLLEETELSHHMSALSLEREANENFYRKDPLPVPKEILKTYDLPAAVIMARTHSAPEPCLVASCSDRSLRFISLEDHLPLGDSPVNPHDAVILAIDFHPTQPHWMLTAAMDGSVRITNLSTSATSIASWKDHTKYVVHAVFVGPEWACTASYDGTLNIYHHDPAGPEAWTRKAHITLPGPVEGMCGDPESAQVYVSTRASNHIHIYHLPDLLTKAQEDGPVRPTRRINLNANGDDWCSFTATHLALSPGPSSTRYLAVGTDSSLGLISVYLAREGRLLQSWWAGDVGDLARGRCAWAGQRLVSAPGDRDIHILDPAVSTSSSLCTLKDHTGNVRNVWYDPKRHWVISCGFDRTIRIWTGKEGDSSDV
ncbi:WD40-repeat-containing domain protein [Piptocephalis cylindrospora]|uniref:WD40-repeat-containing domain protein n=1 Tax=Piptocephalis cylindrospora TaxID=1907219 RepID=A0A4P9Y3W1_9FUNG|nr:WD40-repeat-containing domain protein [Piptocephalis cylindrospora]|eukprot:RKP13342.1 WD40-repeat-containing domain protein [Piptocephalis cylindrospora]